MKLNEINYFKDDEFDKNAQKTRFKFFQNEKILDENKKRQLKLKKAKNLIQEIIINFLFLFVLFAACYSNTNQNSYHYNEHLKQTFISDTSVSGHFLFI